MSDVAIRLRGRYCYVFDNLVPEPDGSAELRLWVALPMTRAGQRAEILAISPEPDAVHEDEAGNRIACWRLSGFDGDRVCCSYDVEVEASPIRAAVTAGAVGDYDRDSAEYERFTRDEPWLELTDEVRARAAEIAGDEVDPWLAARRIFDWVVAHFDYEYPDMASRGAHASLARRKGDCGELSLVFCALCRARGIPARTVTCVWPEGGGHQWAEISIPPHGWLPVDTSLAEALTPGSKALLADQLDRFAERRGLPTRDPAWLFGNLYPGRVIVSVGNNIEVDGRCFRFLQPGGAQAHPPAVELAGLAAPVVHGGFFCFGEALPEPEQIWARAERELAQAYKDAGLVEQAERGLRAKLADKPEDAVAWLDLGQIAMNRGDLDAAIAAFGSSLAGRAGSLAPVVHGWALNLRGRCHDLRGERELAIADYERVIATGVEHGGALEFARAGLAGAES